MSETNQAKPSPATGGEGCSAAEMLKQAKADFEKARDFYESLRHQAAERIDSVRKTTVGDAIDGTLDAVRRHPGAGLALAALAGFYLGRLFRR
jgi:ElaB/YqjD/DUF883 family membrane-anchored ribosome-binding protein